MTCSKIGVDGEVGHVFARRAGEHDLKKGQDRFHLVSSFAEASQEL